MKDCFILKNLQFTGRKEQAMNKSPLRYPGGKSKLYPLLECIINKLNYPVTYIEPFAGGAGLALALLFNHDVENIILNDGDKAIYSVWRGILTETKKFIKLINDTPVTIDEWKKQRDIYLNNNKKYSIELGFATFFLNRTNRSGILKAGPIGGYAQQGKYKIDCRFNKKDLIERILEISKMKKHIRIFNYDVRDFVNKVINHTENCFVYFDPPYYKKGVELYKNYFNDQDHLEISEQIKALNVDWLVTYDNNERIKELYNEYQIRKYVLNYSVANTGHAEELIFVSSERLWPSDKEMDKLKIQKS